MSKLQNFFFILADSALTRLSQESTWRGILAIITASGVYLNPAHADAIIALGLFLIGAINVAKNK
jgi:hypothetical protein